MSQYPFVSVVMPVRNEGHFIARSLGAVLEQDYPVNRMEILVVDGMSTDGTREFVTGLQTKHNNLRLLSNPGRIAPTGLNVALKGAGGDVVVRVDGHCEIATDYVRSCIKHLEASGVEAVGGPLETVGTTRIAAAIAVAMSSPFGVGGVAFRTVKDREMLVDTVAFPAYTRAAISKAGFFDEELVRNQDDEYNYRLRKLGGRILLTPEIRSRYYSRSTLPQLWSQYFYYGYWKVRVMQKHVRLMQPRQFVPPAFVMAVLLSFVASPFSGFGRLAFGLATAFYAVANLAAAFLSARKEGWRLLPYLPLVFSILHVAYGTGFLIGLIRFCSRWQDREMRNDFAAGLSSSQRS
jgi:cellulose synthase/poly-beta-1,6-N-acetylglucosamine synthase-like glycosyltransferase